MRVAVLSQDVAATTAFIASTMRWRCSGVCASAASQAATNSRAPLAIATTWP
jgi:hypothetical protein